MSPSTSGNISIKFKDKILISATGTCLNDLSYDDIVLIDYDGNLIEGKNKPSSEKIMHSEIYTQRDDVNAIIHCHCPLITAFSVAGIEINEAILPDFVLTFGKVPLVDYFCPSSLDLAINVGKTLLNYDAVLLKNHGVVFADATLKGAFYKAELLRAYVEIYFGAQVLGGVKKLKKKDVLEITKLYKK